MKLQTFKPLLVSLLVTSALLGLSTSCGKSGGGNNSNSLLPTQPEDKNRQEEESVVLDVVPQGQYKFFIRPINTQVFGMINSGSGTIKAQADNFNMTLYFDDAAIVKHMQAIHDGDACPTLANDTNGDGYIDHAEAMATAGEILIPLDSDVNSQDAGKGIYPSGEDYTYQKMGRLSKMIADLKAPDTNPNDFITKLKPGQGLGFAGKVIMVYGAPAFKILPTTVQAMEGMTPQQSLPISCGIIEKLEAVEAAN